MPPLSASRKPDARLHRPSFEHPASFDQLRAVGFHAVDGVSGWHSLQLQPARRQRGRSGVQPVFGRHRKQALQETRHRL